MDCLKFLTKSTEAKQQKHQGKQEKREAQEQKREAKEQERETLRRTDPNGLLKIALKPGMRRKSFTAADPAKFYRKEGHSIANEDTENQQDVKSQARGSPVDESSRNK